MGNPIMFRNRTHAGKQLADELAERDPGADIVMGIPRGALPVARPVADRLGVPLDVVVARKIGAPNNPELALGAVASDGSAWLNEELVERLGVPAEYIEKERENEAENARKKAERFRGSEKPPDLTGQTVVVVDDGVATGATAVACLRQVQEAGAERVILAVPVGSPDSLTRVEADADDIVALQTPSDFRAVGQYYRDFEQVSDEEAMAYLDRGEPSTPE